MQEPKTPASRREPCIRKKNTQQWGTRLYSWEPFFFFFIPFITLALLSPSLPVVTQIRGHIAGPPPPSPLRYVCIQCYCEKSSAFSSLVDSRRIVDRPKRDERDLVKRPGEKKNILGNPSEYRLMPPALNRSFLRCCSNTSPATPAGRIASCGRRRNRPFFFVIFLHLLTAKSQKGVNIKSHLEQAGATALFII